MLQKYSIMLHPIILCLFGLALITVSPVFAQDSDAFVECQSMHWNEDKKAKKNCFRDLAKKLQADLAAAISSIAQYSAAAGGLDAGLAIANARIAELESGEGLSTNPNDDWCDIAKDKEMSLFVQCKNKD